MKEETLKLPRKADPEDTSASCHLLRGLTLVGQDWGGLIGLRLVAGHPDRFARVVASNTGLPTGDVPMPDVWLRFRQLVRTAPELSVSRLVQSGCQATSCRRTRASGSVRWSPGSSATTRFASDARLSFSPGFWAFTFSTRPSSPPPWPGWR